MDHLSDDPTLRNLSEGVITQVHKDGSPTIFTVAFIYTYIFNGNKLNIHQQRSGVNSGVLANI